MLPAYPRGGEPAQPSPDKPAQLREPDGERNRLPTAVVRIVLPTPQPARARPESVVPPNAGGPAGNASSQDDVKLSGLLDLLAGHYDSAEFARLRGSAAADAYVSFDQLRALWLKARYDPAYDEVRIDG